MLARAALPVALVLLSACTGREPRETLERAPYGAPCERNDDCASGSCLLTGEPFCTQECADDCACPAGATCRRVDDALSVCAPGENRCPSALPDGGGAPSDVGSPPVDAGPDTEGRGPGEPCTTSSECDDVLSAGGTGPSPEYMTVPQQCFSEASAGIPGGICSMTDCVTNFRRDPCPSETNCTNFRSWSLCLPECEDDSDCRDGWVCRPDMDRWDSVCWLSCARTGCADGLVCKSDGSCGEPDIVPVDYDVTTRSATLGPPLGSVEDMVTGGSDLSFTLPFGVQLFGRTFPAGTDAVATWQGLFALDRSALVSFVPGDHTRYETAAPVIVAHHYANSSSSAGSVAWGLSGAAPERTLEIEWTTENLSGTGGARFRLRFDEGEAAFVVHYGPIADDVFAESWTQLAMLDASQYEEVVVSTGSPTPASRANTEHTYSPR